MGGRDRKIIDRNEQILRGRQKGREREKEPLLIEVGLGMMTSCCRFLYFLLLLVWFLYPTYVVNYLLGRRYYSHFIELREVCVIF
mgnify:CR=1 FL=1